MKQYYTILVLILFPVMGFSQSSNGLAANLNSVKEDRLNPEQYLWSFTKKKAGKNEKALIDFNAMDNWRGLGNYLSVSDDGGFFAYTINKPSSSFRYAPVPLNSVDSLVVQSTYNSWRLSFASSEPGFFTANGKQYIFQNGTGLLFLKLGNTQSRYVKDVASYKVSQNGRNEWLAYQLKDAASNIVLHNLATGEEKRFSGISAYQFDKSGEYIACQLNSKELMLYNLVTGSEKRFPFVTAYSFADKGKQVVFSLYDSATNKASIWYYNTGMDKAVLKVSDETVGIQGGLTLVGSPSFTDNGHYIKFYLEKKADVVKPNADLAGLEVWNHKDTYLQSTQSKQSEENTVYNAIVNIDNGKLVFLESDDKKLYLSHGDFAVVKKDYKAKYGDRFWEQDKDSCWIVSLKDGSSHLLPIKHDRFWFSPGDNYLVYFDADKGCHYYSYDLHTSVLKDISANVPENQLCFTNRNGGDERKTGYGNLAAWIENDAGVLVYDSYDIWKLELTGKQPAINITNGFGKANTTILNLFATDHYSTNEVPVIKANESLLLRAYNTRNKQNGFCKKIIGSKGNPELLFMGNYFFNSIGGCHDPNLSNRGMAPAKAKNRNTWIVQRQSANDAPNYHETTDLKNFRRLTNFQPQKNFQWLSQELHSFKHLDGKPGQGVLYKPEDFDPTKKYPVLIVFYGAFSDNMHQFRVPAANCSAISPGTSPVWFLNNGYLVFTPDISVTPLKYGPKTFSVIEGAAKYLQQLPYVDANKLGCAAHSWSSKLGAYVFTHSSSIAATTISGCATYNPIANALSPIGHGMESLEVVHEWGSLWENKDAWLDITAVLQADKAKGALLLLENKQASSVYKEQAFQFFTALRRLNKNAWWLKYDKGSHTLEDPKETRDYTIRYTQFFDHYLKNAPSPQWMTQGIPSRLKGIENRYELDPEGFCNAPNGEVCPICDAWNKQYKKTPEMFQKEIKDWSLDKDIAEELEQKIKERRKKLDKEGEVRIKEVMKMLENK